MEKWISIGKASKILGVSISALRMWEKRGILVPNRTPTGHRRYALSQIESFEIKKYQRTSPKPAYIYARVSTQKQADAGNLDRQIGLDIDLPRYSSQQWALGKEIEREDLNIGDVLFFEGSSKVLLPGLYIGNEQFIIVTEFEGVAIRDLNISDSYWSPRYVGARRYEKINE